MAGTDQTAAAFPPVHHAQHHLPPSWAIAFKSLTHSLARLSLGVASLSAVGERARRVVSSSETVSQPGRQAASYLTST